MKPDLSQVDPLGYNLATRTNLGDVVVRTAALFPDRVAVVDRGEEITYARLAETVDRLGHGLRSLGLEPGTPVALTMMNSWQMLATYYACARAGLVHVPLNYNLTGVELEYLVAQSGASLVLADPELAPRVTDLEEVEVPVRALRDADDSLLAAARSGEVPALDVEVGDGDLAQLLYTSGTTSHPKGAMMTHRALIHQYLGCLTALDLSADDEPLHVMPLYHSAQMHVFLLPWLASVFGLPDAVAGAWIGGNIDTTAAVAAAGAIAGEDALQIATIVKTTQNALIGIVAIALTINFIGDGLRDALDPKLKQ